MNRRDTVIEKLSEMMRLVTYDDADKRGRDGMRIDTLRRSHRPNSRPGL